MNEKRVKVERWDDDEYIIELDGRPQGETLTRTRAESIRNWLLTVPECLIQNLSTSHNTD